jgi:hypothetical protein
VGVGVVPSTRLQMWDILKKEKGHVSKPLSSKKLPDHKEEIIVESSYIICGEGH